VRTFANKPNPRPAERVSRASRAELDEPPIFAAHPKSSTTEASGDLRRDFGFDFSAVRTHAAERPAGVPSPVAEVLLSPGHPLDSATRANLEAHLGARLGGVTIHTDGASARSARSMGARAYTVGSHMVFDDGEYRPGTPIGDMLLAHEAAHVAQQSGGQSRTGLEDAPLEYEANAAAFSFALSLGKLTSRAGAAMRSGIRLQRCPISSSKHMSPPSFFGPDSKETLETINQIMETGASLQNWIAYGTAIAAFDDPLGGMHSPEAAEAMQAIPSIVRRRAVEQIDLLMVVHDNDLNRQEKAFWNNLRTQMNAK
jgi:hypothetical protein